MTGLGARAHLRPLADKLAALALGLLLTIGGLEVGLRLLADRYWQRGARTDSRDGSLLAELEAECPGCRRVLCLGDSFTYGMGASEGMDYPRQLERLLNEGAPSPHTQVLNGGIGSSNSTVVREILDNYLTWLRPDLVTVMVGGANYWEYYGLSEFLGERRSSRRLLSILQHLAVVRLLSHARYSLSPEEAQATGSTTRSMSDSFPLTLRWLDAHGRGWADMEAHTPELYHGLRLLEANLVPQALAALEHAVELYPEDTRVHWALAVALRRAKREEDAWARYEQALTLDPTDPTLYFGLGELCYDLTIFGEERHRWFQKAIEVDPSYGPPYCLLGDSLLGPQDHQPERAIDLLWRGVELEPLHLPCYIALQEYYRDRGGPEALERELVRRDLDGPIARAHVDGMTEEVSVDEREAWLRHDLHRMAATLAERGVPLLLVQYIPDRGPNRVMESLARDEGLPIVTTEAAVRARVGPDGAMDDLFLRDNHYSDRGNAIVAEIMLDSVRELLDGPRQPAGATGRTASGP